MKLQCTGDRVNFIFIDIAQKFEREMEVRRSNPANTGNMGLEMDESRRNVADGWWIDLNADERANHSL